MKKFVAVATAIAAFGFVNVASAADMPVKAVRAPVAVAVNWTGFYLGVNGGFAWRSRGGQHVDWTSTAFDPGPNFPGSTSGKGIFGLQGGYNWQINPTWLVGLEVDFDSARLSQSNAAPLLFLGVPFGIANTQISQDLRWLASARGRVGYTWDMAMLYATGGVAWSNTHYFARTQDNGPDLAISDFSKTSTGWVAGAGLEYLVMRNWVLRAEYLYYALNNSQSDTTHALPAFPVTIPVVHSWDRSNVQTVRFGLSYLFH